MKPRVSRTEHRAERILAVVGAARDVPSGVRMNLEIVDGDARVAAILLLPNAAEPVPAALLLHGFGSQKERMADTVGDALMRQGIAALAVDLPLHGAREGSPHDLKNTSPMQLLGSWGAAVGETRLARDYLASHAAIDRRFLAIVGYSLGSFLANIVAAESADVRAVVLVASGDLPEGLPFDSLVRAVVDPLRAVQQLARRPLLMVNGRFDRTVRQSQAERLFAAAGEPKSMRWYGGGHWPGASDIEYVATWLACELSDRRSRRPA